MPVGCLPPTCWSYPIVSNGGRGSAQPPGCRPPRMQNPLDVDPPLDEDPIWMQIPLDVDPPDACWEANPPPSPPSPVEMFVKTLPCPKLCLRAVITISWTPFSVKYCDRNKEINAKNIDLWIETNVITINLFVSLHRTEPLQVKSFSVDHCPVEVNTQDIFGTFGKYVQIRVDSK